MADGRLRRGTKRLPIAESGFSVDGMMFFEKTV